MASSLDYVLKVTDQSQVDYLGFSMGTTMVFVLLSEKPEYNKKVTKFKLKSNWIMKQKFNNWLVLDHEQFRRFQTYLIKARLGTRYRITLMNKFQYKNLNY